MGLIDDIRVDIADDSGAIPSGVPSHELLSASHGDTTVGSPSAGSLVVGTPWHIVTSGNEGEVLTVYQGQVQWAPSSGAQGPQGETGASGVAGPSGLQGIQGETGPNPSGFYLAFNAENLTVPIGALNIPSFSTRNGHGVVNFDDTISETGILESTMRNNYESSYLLYVNIYWTAKTATTGSVVWEGQFEHMEPNGLNIDIDSFAASKSIVTLTDAVSGKINKSTISYNNSEADNMLANSPFRYKINRAATSGLDDLSGDAQLLRISLEQ